MLHYVSVPFRRQQIGNAEQHGGDQAYRCAHFLCGGCRGGRGDIFKIMVCCVNLKRCRCDVGCGGGCVEYSYATAGKDIIMVGCFFI